VKKIEECKIINDCSQIVEAEKIQAEVTQNMKNLTKFYNLFDGEANISGRILYKEE